MSLKNILARLRRANEELELDYPELKLFKHIPIPPGLARGGFLFASAAATINFGKEEFTVPQSTLVEGVPFILERYWGLLLLFAGTMAIIGCLLPARFKVWHLFYRVGVWSLLMSWLLTAFILTFASAYTSVVGVVLALCVALPSFVAVLQIQADDKNKPFHKKAEEIRD